MQKENKVLIIIPAFNEERNIASVIHSIQKDCPKHDIVVINDGSSDSTAELAEKCGVPVISLPFNLGIGGAVQTGLLYADRNGYDVAIQLDADGQHKSEEVEKLTSLIEQNNCDMVMGSRFLADVNYSSTFMRRLGNRIFSFLIALVAGQSFADSTSGFRAFGRKAIEFLSEHYPIDFPEPESLVLLKRNGFKINEVSVSMRERQGGESSVTRFKAVYFMISISIAILIDALKRPLRKEVTDD
ncbi:MAG: glycosyltransferase family 2 protein [bacterium]